VSNQFYLDANIWLDIFEKRGYNGEVAKKLLEKIITENDMIFYSDLIIVELKKVGYSKTEIHQILNIAKPDHLKRIHIYKEQIDEARRIAKMQDVPKADALHAILARDNQLQLISRDRDFQKLKHITNTKFPEDFI